MSMTPRDASGPIERETVGPIRRGPSHFRIADVRRVVKAVQAAGLHVGSIQIEGGKITVIPAGAPGASVVDDDPVVL